MTKRRHLKVNSTRQRSHFRALKGLEPNFFRLDKIGPLNLVVNAAMTHICHFGDIWTEYNISDNIFILVLLFFLSTSSYPLSCRAPSGMWPLLTLVNRATNVTRPLTAMMVEMMKYGQSMKATGQQYIWQFKAQTNFQNVKHF